MGDYAFWACCNVEIVTIPESVTEIGTGAFTYCTSLDTVNYEGTDEQWAAIAIGGENDALLQADRPRPREAAEAARLLADPARAAQAAALLRQAVELPKTA